MTPQEAIKILEVNAILSPKATTFNEGVEIAKKAIEKQIPKKPILDTLFPSGVKWFMCAACNHNNVEKNDPFCHHCGQALDWSDSE